jgi:hypothetical protein
MGPVTERQLRHAIRAHRRAKQRAGRINHKPKGTNMKFFKALSGKKTYLVAFAYASVQLARSFGVEIPPLADHILLAAGAGTLRHSIGKAAA